MPPRYYLEYSFFLAAGINIGNVAATVALTASALLVLPHLQLDGEDRKVPRRGGGRRGIKTHHRPDIVVVRCRCRGGVIGPQLERWWLLCDSRCRCSRCLVQDVVVVNVAFKAVGYGDRIRI